MTLAPACRLRRAARPIALDLEESEGRTAGATIGRNPLFAERGRLCGADRAPSKEGEEIPAAAPAVPYRC